MDAHVAGVQCPYGVNPSFRDNTRSPSFTSRKYTSQASFLTFKSLPDLCNSKLSIAPKTGILMSECLDSAGILCWTFTQVNLCRHAPASVFPLAYSVAAAWGPTVLMYQLKTSWVLSTSRPHREKHWPENGARLNRGGQNHDVSVTRELAAVKKSIQMCYFNKSSNTALLK